MQTSQQDFGWVRRWYPIEQSIAAQTSGYLAERADDEGLTLADVSSVPCLVLLGTPGMGKSREAEGAVRTLRTQGELADLVAVGRRADPLQSLLELLDGPHAAAWRSEGRAWHLFIDGIDEALGAAVGFAASLGKFLDALAGASGDLARMRIRFLCRTVEWTQAFDSLIETHWRDNEIAKLQIAPLTRDDVVMAVDAVSGDSRVAKGFLQRVSDIGAESLASRPVSLRLLADLQSRLGALPSSQAEIYRQGLEVLVDEHDGERRRRIRRGALNASERLMVAARIAAANAFSGRPQVWAGLEAPPAGSEAIPLSDIAGGVEPSPPVSFTVSEADLLETVRTSLFVPLGEGLLAGLTRHSWSTWPPVTWSTISCPRTRFSGFWQSLIPKVF